MFPRIAVASLVLSCLGCTTEIDTSVPAESDWHEVCVEPPLPRQKPALTHIEPSEEFDFDPHGYLVNLPDNSRVALRTPLDGDPEVVAPYNATEIGAVRVLPDDALAVVDEYQGALMRITSEGGREVLHAGMRAPNSLAVHPDGRLFVSDIDRIVQVDAYGEYAPEVVLEVERADLDGLVLSPDLQTLYANDESTGVIWAVDLVSGEGTVLTQIVLGTGGSDRSASSERAEDEEEAGGFLDGMTTDLCGNLYVVRMDGQLFRIGADGVPIVYVDFDGSDRVLTSVHFGSGVGGWEADHLYVMDRQGEVLVVDAGIPGVHR